MQFLKNHWFGLSLSLVLLIAAFLRLYNLVHLPPALYWEEVALGYDAYSLLQTGKDHHGNAWPIVAVESFGDYKPSGYFYALLPSIAVFGLTEFAVRFPSALAGIMTVLGIGILARLMMQLLFPERTFTDAKLVQVIASFVTAISPWLIQFSRGGWEVNLATCFLLWGVIAAIQPIYQFNRDQKNSHSTQIFWIAAAILFSLSMYTYHSTRLIAPLVFGSLLFWKFCQDLYMNKVSKVIPLVLPIFVAGVFFSVLISPLLLPSQSSSVQQRFAETSITGDGSYVKVANELRASGSDTFVNHFLTHRYFILAQQFTHNFFSHFRLDFLFLIGDQNTRHSTGIVGLFYWTDALWLGIGTLLLARTFYQYKTSRPTILFLFFWLIIGVLPASLTMATPHQLRILPTAPVFIIMISLGILELKNVLNFLPKKRQLLFSAAIVGAFLLVSFSQFFRYWRYYTLIYPHTLAANDWQEGYKEMITALKPFQDGQTPISMTREHGRPAMYYWFYTLTPPTEVQAAAVTAPQDKGEFIKYQNLHFINTVNEAKTGVVVSSVEQFNDLPLLFSSVEKLSEVRGSRGQLIWVISRVNGQKQ